MGVVDSNGVRALPDELEDFSGEIMRPGKRAGNNVRCR